MVVMLLAGQEREGGAPRLGLLFEYLVRGNMQSQALLRERTGHERGFGKRMVWQVVKAPKGRVDTEMM